MARKLSISRAWDESRRVLRRDGKLIATVALALLVLPGTVTNMVSPRAEPGELPEMGLWSVVWVLGLLIALVGQLAIVRMAIGAGESVGEAIRHGARRLPVYLAGQLIWAMPFALLFVLLVPLLGPPDPSAAAALVFLGAFAGFLFVAVRMLLTLPVATAEPVGPLAMLRRSWQLTSGNWWRLLGFLLLFLIGAGVVVVATAAILGVVAETLLGGTEPFSLGALLVSLGSQIVQSAAYVILIVMLAMLYLQRAGTSEAAEVSVPSSGT